MSLDKEGDEEEEEDEDEEEEEEEEEEEDEDEEEEVEEDDKEGEAGSILASSQFASLRAALRSDKTEKSQFPKFV